MTDLEEHIKKLQSLKYDCDVLAIHIRQEDLQREPDKIIKSDSIIILEALSEFLEAEIEWKGSML